MKIGLDTVSETMPETYFRHLARLLAEYAPEHEYIVDNRANNHIDIYHGFKSKLPLSVHLRRVRRVVTVRDLNFLHYPQAFTLTDRLVHVRLCKYSCRAADCVITMNRVAKEELVDELGIDEWKIKVVMQLGVHPPVKECDETQYDIVRKKYSLPRNFVLMVGAVEARHNQLDVVEAMLELGLDTGLVICGRRTQYADFLLSYARRVGGTSCIEFVYEPEPADIPVLFRMARAFIYIPDPEAEASVLPVVEALRAGVPIILGESPVHREAAGDAAVYVPRGGGDRLAAAIECVLSDEDSRREQIVRERARAEVFSEYAVAQRLIEIYSSL